MTESLAKGLTTRFFDELESGIEPVKDKFSEQLGRKKITRNSWSYVRHVTRDCFKDYALAMYEGGSKRKPYISLNLLLPLKSRCYNSWDEKCLTGTATIINLVPFLIHSLPVPYNISEHAVARLFLRTRISLDNGLVDVKAVNSELIYIPFWSCLWGLFLSDENLFGECQVPIPAPNGLFFAQTNLGKPHVEIRTFVGDHLLLDSQAQIKESMIAMSKNFLNTPFSSFTILENLGIDETETVTAFICRKLLLDERITIILSAIMTQNTAKLDIGAVREKFINFLRIRSGQLPENFFELFDKVGIRDAKNKLYLHQR